MLIVMHPDIHHISFNHFQILNKLLIINYLRKAVMDVANNQLN